MGTRTKEVLTKADVLQVKASDLIPQVVEAAMSMTAVGGLGADRTYAQAMQAAMAAAVQACYDEGRLDPEYIRAKQLEARDRVRSGRP